MDIWADAPEREGRPCYLGAARSAAAGTWMQRALERLAEGFHSIHHFQ